MELTREIALKVRDVVDAGLIDGIGEPTPGKMCVEAAVCFALGLPHSDNPPCVGTAVRALKIALNDRSWSSKEARAHGMRRVAIAQLGSDGIDQVEFAKIVALETIRQIVPIALRAAASVIPSHQQALEVAATCCEVAIDLTTARKAANEAKSAAHATYAAANDAANDAANAAANAANAAANAAAYAAADAAHAAAYAAYAAHATYAAANAANAKQKTDGILGKLAEIAVQALIKLGSQGAQWLDVCD